MKYVETGYQNKENDMKIWQCSGCNELMVGKVHPVEGWRFNGTCFQHDCENIRKTLEEQGYSPDGDYQYASEEVSGKWLCDVINLHHNLQHQERLKAEIQQLNVDFDDIEKDRDLLKSIADKLQENIQIVQTENEGLKEGLRKLHRLLTYKKIVLDDVANILNQSNNQSNNSSTGHTQGSETK